MGIDTDIQQIALHKNFRLLSNQIVEGFLVGLHKSPFKGFSSEFLEHKNYNAGEPTRHIDWKLYAKTGRLYTKQFQEETNLNAHIILDNSSSMHFPERKISIENPNKITFAALAIAALMNLLKRQRDAVGMSIYSDTYEFYAPEKANDRHHQKIIDNLISAIQKQPLEKKTKTHVYLPQIAEKLNQRSFILLFTDMFQTETDEIRVFEALRFFKYKKHSVVLFHVLDKAKEIDLDYENTPQRFVDMETGDVINVLKSNFQELYKTHVEAYFQRLKLKCMQYGIDYVSADISEGVKPILQSFLVQRQNFI